jgi:hypothetical protein
MEPNSYRVDTTLLAPNPHRACIEWITSLGLAPANIAGTFAIVRGKNGWELHVTEYLRNGNGHNYIDQAKRDIVSQPVVLQLGADASWPDITQGLIAS